MGTDSPGLCGEHTRHQAPAPEARQTIDPGVSPGFPRPDDQSPSGATESAKNHAHSLPRPRLSTSVLVLVLLLEATGTPSPVQQPRVPRVRVPPSGLSTSKSTGGCSFRGRGRAAPRPLGSEAWSNVGCRGLTPMCCPYHFKPTADAVGYPRTPLRGWARRSLTASSTTRPRIPEAWEPLAPGRAKHSPGIRPQRQRRDRQ
jgi:hypothetical protein